MKVSCNCRTSLCVLHVLLMWNVLMTVCWHCIMCLINVSLCFYIIFSLVQEPARTIKKFSRSIRGSTIPKETTMGNRSRLSGLICDSLYPLRGMFVGTFGHALDISLWVNLKLFFTSGGLPHFDCKSKM